MEDEKTKIMARKDSTTLSRPFPFTIKFERGFTKMSYDHSSFYSIKEGLDVRESQLFKKTINVSKFIRERDIKSKFNGILSVSGSVPGLEDLGGISSTSGFKIVNEQKTTSKTCYCSINISIEKCRIFLSRKQIQLEKSIEKDVERIIDTHSKEIEKGVDKEKVHAKILKNLAEYFTDTGYFVPMHIGLGGLVVIKFEVKEKEELEEATKILSEKFKAEVKEDAGKEVIEKIGIGQFLEKVIDKLDEDEKKKKEKEEEKEKEKKDENELDDGATGGLVNIGHDSKKTNKKSDILRNVSIEAKGGDCSSSSIDFKDLSKWTESLHCSNYEVVCLENLSGIDAFFSSDLKDKFEPFRDEVKELMNKPFELLEMYSHLPRFESFVGMKIDGNVQKTFSAGTTQKIEGMIDEKVIPLNQQGSLFVKNEYIFEGDVNPDEIIVGYIIEAARKDENNGCFTIEDMNNKSYKLKFQSKRFRDQIWNVHVFFIKA